MSRILVTGGAGFIGSHAADAYLAAGHDVVVVDDLSAGRRENIPGAARFVQLDIRTDALDQLFEKEKPDTVSHFAAQIDVRRSIQEPLFDADVNVLGTLRLLDNCMRHKTARFIFASTGGAIYGDADVLPASEETPPKPLSHYAAAKFCAEVYIRLYHALHGLDYCILRFPNVYGPRQSPEGEAGVCAIFIRQMLENKAPILYGLGTPLRDYIYVGDIARAAVLALERGTNQVLNMGSSTGTSVRELFEMLKSLMDFPLDPKLAPARPGEVASSYITGERAERALGWRPEVSLEEGLQRTITFIRDASRA